MTAPTPAGPPARPDFDPAPRADAPRRPGRFRLARRPRARWLVGCLLAAGAGCAAAGTASVREQEIARCLPGELRTWADGRDGPAAGGVHLVYRHAGAPAQFSEPQVLLAVRRAAGAWAACGVAAEVVSERDAARHPGTAAVVQWNAVEARGNFALADLSRRTLSISPQLFELLAVRNPRHPAQDTLQMVLSHELGHFLGLRAHSRRCVDVMSYYDDGHGGTCLTRDGGSYKSVVEYRSLLPTACDIERCRAANGLR